MAFFADSGTFLNNKSITIDLKKTLGGFGAKSMVFLNRDNADDVSLSFDNGLTICKIVAQKQSVITGISDFSSVILNYDGNSAGDYSVAISSDSQPPIIEY